jgi:NADH:ubiquinone oxidoreductase subunit K
LSQGWVEFQAEMGWNGKSWLLTPLAGGDVTRILAAIFYGLSTIVFVIASIGLFASQGWARTGLIIASSISIFTIVVFWDGSFRMPVEKGAIGLLISLAILVAALIWKGRFA